MRQKTSLVLLVVIIASASFLVGQWRGGVKESEKHMQEEMRHWGQFASLEETVLQTMTVRSNTMKSGTYVMKLWFSNEQLPPHEVVLTSENGRITANSFSRSGGPQVLSTTGNVVSWTEEGAGYEANAKYVGLIDGDAMWGHVYGWNPGDQSVGLWRIYPKPAEATPTNNLSR